MNDDSICQACPTPLHCATAVCQGTCPSCLPGYRLDSDGNCTSLLCLLYGCGAANVGVVCNEVNSTSFSCTCPGASPIIVIPPDVFEGCDSSPSDNDVVAHINGTHLDAFLRNGILEITGVVLVEVNGNTFTININSTVPATSLENSLKSQLAAFLGGSYTSQDITLAYGSSKRDAQNDQVHVTVNGNNFVAGTAFYQFPVLLFGLLLLGVHL